MSPSSSRRPLPLPSRLLYIADSSHAPDPAELVRAAAAAGVTFIEVRRKGDGDAPDSARRLAEIRRCIEAAGSASVIVDDRVDLALMAGAAGAHVGQDDMPAEDARRLLGAMRLLGLSTHDELQLAAAQDLPLDYVALGPIFQSSTKSGHAEPVGLERLMRCCDTSRLPVVAIGGIDASNLDGVLEAGAACACVAAAISRGDVASQASRLLAAVLAHRPVVRARPGEEAIVLTGPPGSGKSTVGKLLADRLGLPFHDLDSVVTGGESMDSVLGQGGEASLREMEGAALATLLRVCGRAVVSLGGGTLRGERARVLLHRAGARLVQIEVSPAECLRRLAAAGVRRPLVEMARHLGPVALVRHFAERIGSQWGTKVDGMGLPGDVAARIEGVLERPMASRGFPR